MDKDEFYMWKAIEQARKAEEINEVPIGAVVVLEDEIIGTGYNLRESEQRSIAHAELLAIDMACKSVGSWRLENAVLYVTLEPCPMCAGAIVLSRINKVIYGAKDPKGGCAGTLMNLLTDSRFNHQSEVESGVLEKECSLLLSLFFQKLRQEKKERKRLEKSN
jgi:tRNA(adenine34) deaminase